MARVVFLKKVQIQGVIMGIEDGINQYHDKEDVTQAKNIFHD
jgi:hypothetical protein